MRDPSLEELPEPVANAAGEPSVSCSLPLSLPIGFSAHRISETTSVTTTTAKSAATTSGFYATKSDSPSRPRSRSANPSPPPPAVSEESGGGAPL